MSQQKRHQEFEILMTTPDALIKLTPVPSPRPSVPAVDVHVRQ